MHVAPQDEQELLLLLSKGSERAFRAIYDLYHKQVYFQAYNYLQSAQLAEDAVQEVFLKLWMKREKADDIKSLKNYIFIVARNCIISDLRKKVFHSEIRNAEDADWTDETDLLPDRQVDLKQAKEIVNDAIAALPPQQKKVFQLSRDGGLANKEIGLELGISEHTVKSHMKAALRSIRHALESKSVDLGAILFLFLMKK